MTELLFVLLSERVGRWQGERPPVPKSTAELAKLDPTGLIEIGVTVGANDGNFVAIYRGLKDSGWDIERAVQISVILIDFDCVPAKRRVHHD